ncbi:iron-containing redox enzyme family protein [Pendulispora brunnea]|uniref:Iron-containing redox enzyme family protein n=1 Tax=Pendulispora brunnea TaxID=2905690 RepID=A0ABZ2KAB1_9BACT
MQSGRASNERSLHAYGRDQLQRLWRATHRSDAPDRVLQVFDALLPINAVPKGWDSFVSDDHSPYEFSLLLGGAQPEIRVLAEPLPPRDPTTRLTMGHLLECGLAAAETLRRDFGADLSRFQAVADLFLPKHGAHGSFLVWFAASFDAQGTPSFKAYFNPQVHGPHEAPRLVEEMLHRLGFPGAWSTVVRAMPRGPYLDELRFVSLDLVAGHEARVKVYGFHRQGTLHDLVRVAGAVPNATPELVESFCGMLSGGHGILSERAPASCLAFVGGHAVPRTVTSYIPIRAFAGDDADARARLVRAMSALGMAPAPFESALESLATRPLDAGSGLIAWAGLRTGRAPRVNVYFAPTALGDAVRHPTVAPSADSDCPSVVIRHCEGAPITTHPLLQRIQREPHDLRKLALLMLNVRRAITRDFARRLARIVATVEEDGIRSILVKQLNDELGDGDPTRLHKDLFERFIIGLMPWLPSPITDEVLAPGAAFARVQDELYCERSPYEGLGAALIMEVYGKQFDLFVGEQFRRASDPLPPDVLEWLTLHEALELEHVDEATVLARFIPAGRKSRLAARGARELADAAWAFLDGTYHVCYP